MRNQVRAPRWPNHMRVPWGLVHRLRSLHTRMHPCTLTQDPNLAVAHHCPVIDIGSECCGVDVAQPDRIALRQADPADP